jgi:DNA-binding MarR family transcriptional regulator
VFAQIKRGGSRLTDLAKGANMTPQSMGELVAELVDLGYVERRPDPTDGRAKLIVLTDRGNACIDAAETTIQGLEERITEVLGARAHAQLRTLLTKLLAEA